MLVLSRHATSLVLRAATQIKIIQDA